MSFTSTVPAAVPSVFQSSVPIAGVYAAKNSVSPTMATESLCGSVWSTTDEPEPGLMSASSAVPAAVPSVRNHSNPWTPSWRGSRSRP